MVQYGQAQHFDSWKQMQHVKMKALNLRLYQLVKRIGSRKSSLYKLIVCKP